MPACRPTKLSNGDRSRRKIDIQISSGGTEEEASSGYAKKKTENRAPQALSLRVLGTRTTQEQSCRKQNRTPGPFRAGYFLAKLLQDELFCRGR